MHQRLNFCPYLTLTIDPQIFKNAEHFQSFDQQNQIWMGLWLKNLLYTVSFYGQNYVDLVSPPIDGVLQAQSWFKY